MFQRQRRTKLGVGTIGLASALIVASLVIAASSLRSRPAPSEPVAVPTPPATTKPSLPSVLTIDDAPQKRFLAAGLVDTYRLDLDRGDYLHAVVEQLGIDVAVTVDDPEGRPLLQIDSPNGEHGIEPIILTTDTGGRHTIRVVPSAQGAGGTYQISIEARRVATDVDRRRSRGAREFFAGESLRRLGDPTSLNEALSAYRSALTHWSRASDAVWVAETRERLARVHQQLGDPERAMTHLERAHALLRSLRGEESKLCDVLIRLARLHRDSGDADGAKSAYLEALQATDRTGDQRLRAALINNLALLEKRQGNAREALRLYTDALALWRQLAEPRHETTTLSNIGMLYLSLGDPGRARRYLRRALGQIQDSDRPRRTARVVAGLAKAERRLGNLGKSLDLYSRALQLQEDDNDRRGFLETTLGLAQTQAAMGSHASALESYRRAAVGFRALGDAFRLAVVDLELGWLHLEMDQLPEAEQYFSRAFEQARTLGNRLGEGSALYGIARCDARAGRLDSALETMEKAVAIIESLRSDAHEPTLRASFLGRKYDYYVHWVDLLLRLHDQAPDRGFDRRAFEAAERARARSTLDLLRQGSDATGPVAEANALDASTLHGLFDDGSVMLSYMLGPRRSYLWWISADRLEVRYLPPRKDIESLVDTAYRSTSARQRASRMPRRAALAKLSSILLEPIASRLTGQHLVIVPNGALFSVPFAALPMPIGAAHGATGDPLIRHHSISRASSAAVLTTIRNRSEARAPARHRLAILADPVFGPHDSRLADSVEPRNATRRGEGSEVRRSAPVLDDLNRLSRLRASAVEADAIGHLVASDRRLVAHGLDASRQLVLTGTLEGYQIVHFATHGWLAADNEPESSGLVLSLFDPDGQPTDGLLRVSDIFGLELTADLVTLSACRTALGKELRGEGFWGLTQAFQFAGASRVLVSLWAIDDHATATFMSFFYRELLERKASPAAALRAAQQALISNADGRRWDDPFYWAGFVLEGEWRPMSTRQSAGASDVDGLESHGR